MSQKQQLMRLLGEVTDQSIINKIAAILTPKDASDIWDEWDDEVRKDVEEAIRQADAGELIPHEKAVTMLKRWA